MIFLEKKNVRNPKNIDVRIDVNKSITFREDQIRERKEKDQ